ncbi:MAG: DUF1508 domain-containing protein [Clostridia bacterium]|nr:DUF1508 domain-containing protein [Clostridia bacterium]
MDSFNNFFSDLGSRMPFSSDFFARNLSIGGGEINVFFLVLLALVVAVVAIVVIAVCGAKASKAKRKAKQKAEAKPVARQGGAVSLGGAKQADKAQEESAQPAEQTPEAEAVEEQPAEEIKEAEATEEAQPVEEAQPEDENIDVDVVAPVAQEEEQPTETEQPKEAEAAETAQPVEEAQPEDEDIDVDVVAPVAQEEEQPAEEARQEAEPVQVEPVQAEPAEQAEPVEQAEQPKEAEAAEMAQPAEEKKEEPAQPAEQAKEAEVAASVAPAADKLAAKGKTSAKAKNSDAPKVAMEVNQMKKEEVKQEEKAKKGLVGTFEVSLCLDGYRFCLYASNKQLMYESVGFTSSEGAVKGIETFRKTLQESPYIITRDKYGRFRYVFNKRYQGENYTSAASAQSAAESVKRWAENAKVIVRNPKPEELDAYKKGLEGLRTKDDVDWDLVAKEEKEARPMGKFTVEEDGNQDEVIGYRFYLIANNAQILYTSAIYTSASGALKAIDTFKRAVYVGNFYVDEDKFGHFRYILRANATTTYVGESYKTRSSAESSIESVKKFVKCAAIVPFKKGADD